MIDWLRLMASERMAGTNVGLASANGIRKDGQNKYSISFGLCARNSYIYIYRLKMYVFRCWKICVSENQSF